MPEHDETDAPEQADEDEFWEELETEEEKRQHRLARKPKTERWGVENKVVDGEQK